MNIIFLSNLVALIASILNVIIGLIKRKDVILIVQGFAIFLFTLSCLLLGSISGAIINIISLIRNILSYKNKFSFKYQLILILISIVLVICLNKNGFIGYLPLFAFIIYAIFINSKKMILFKSSLLISFILWLIHDYLIKSYTSAIFNFIAILTLLYSIFNIKTRKRKK